MTQELKPCPFCGMQLVITLAPNKEAKPRFEHPYWRTSDGRIDPGNYCILEGFKFTPDYDYQWNTRHNEPQWLPIIEAAIAWYRAYPDEQKVMRAGGYLYDTIKKHIPNPPEVTT